MAFIDMWSELATAVPELSPLFAQKLVNRGWREIRNRRSWSFLFYPTFVSSPLMVNAGTCTIVQGSSTVVFDATATAAMIALNALFPLITLEFRIANAGAVFQIVTYDGVSTITLSQPITIPSAVGASYVVYQSLFPGPVADFVRWVSVYDPNQGYAFTRYHVPQQEINRIDPTRSNQQQPYWISDVAPNAAGIFLYEFWPAPVSGQTFQALIQRAGTDLVKPTDTLPTVIPESVVLSRARWHAYGWAAANAGRLPALKGVNWLALRKDEDSDGTKREYLTAVRQDDEIRLNSIAWRERNIQPFPLDSAWLQSHDAGGFFNWG